MITRIEPGKRMSQAVVANGFVFLAGQVATDHHQGAIAAPGLERGELHCRPQSL